MLAVSSLASATEKATTNHPTLDDLIDTVIEKALPDVKTVKSKLIKNVTQLYECLRKNEIAKIEMTENHIQRTTEQFKKELMRWSKMENNNTLLALTSIYNADHPKEKSNKQAPKNLTEEQWGEKILTGRIGKEFVNFDKKKKAKEIDDNIEKKTKEFQEKVNKV